MGSVTYITLLFGPGIAIFLFFYLVKKYDSKFNSLLLKSYIAGMLCTLLFLVGFSVFRLLDLAIPPVKEHLTLKRALLFSFVIMGFVSELSKFTVYRYYVIPHTEINKPIHAITFSVMTALGFSTMTQICFFCNLFELQRFYPSVMYSFANIPSHIIFAIIMGFFVGLSRFINAKFIYSVIGLFGASFFNGIFNFCLVTSDYKLLSLFAFGSSLIVLVLIIKALFTNTESLS
jgi:protease PrsW